MTLTLTRSPDQDRLDRDQRRADRLLLSRLGLDRYAYVLTGLDGFTSRRVTTLRQPVVVVLRPWGMLTHSTSTFWYVLDRHGARVRFVTATGHTAGTIAHAIAAQARNDSARWSG